LRHKQLALSSGQSHRPFHRGQLGWQITAVSASCTTSRSFSPTTSPSSSLIISLANHSGHRVMNSLPFHLANHIPSFIADIVLFIASR
jgi:hypothetical protein